jgi:arylformamidase
MNRLTDFNPDPAYLDAQYNNRLRVPLFKTHFKQWQADSAQVRASQTCVLDLPYGAGGQAETLDIFPSAPSARQREQEKAPVLVFIHGGYWRSLDKSDHSFIAPAFTQSGACVVIPNYGLCPAVSIQQIVLQQVQALVWVHRNIAKYGGDPSRISIIGHSAGGHLAAMLLACDWMAVAPDLPRQLVRNALSLSGLYDLAPIMTSPFLQNDLRLTASEVQLCSPAYFPEPSGELVALCGADESDEFLRHNALIEHAWGSRCVREREALLGLNHFSVLEALCKPEHRAHVLALELLMK